MNSFDLVAVSASARYVHERKNESLHPSEFSTTAKTMRYAIEIKRFNFAEFEFFFEKNLGFADTDLTHYSCKTDYDSGDISYEPACHPRDATHNGGFHWIYEGQRFFVEYCEEGEPQTDASYFRRLRIHHDDLTILKGFVTYVLNLHKTKKKEENSIVLYSSNTNGFFRSHGSVASQPFDSIYLPTELKDSIVSHVDGFIASKERYLKFGRMYKTAFLLTGVPGSGKSSLVKAIAHKYKRTVYCINLTKEMTDEKMAELSNEIMKNSIMLIEDIDAFFTDRSPNGINISFSALLNLLDGPMSIANGIIIFLTANNPDRLDPALIRPGRIDKIFTFDYPRRSEVHSAFKDLTGITDVAAFKEFYDVVKGARISMSAFVDFLFRFPEKYMEHVDELLGQTRILDTITSSERKLYT